MVLVLKDRTSTTTATVCQPVATATEFPVFSGWVGLGCGFFLVGATGPSKTTHQFHSNPRAFKGGEKGGCGDTMRSGTKLIGENESDLG